MCFFNSTKQASVQMLQTESYSTLTVQLVKSKSHKTGVHARGKKLHLFEKLCLCTVVILMNFTIVSNSEKNSSNHGGVVGKRIIPLFDKFFRHMACKCETIVKFVKTTCVCLGGNWIHLLLFPKHNRNLRDLETKEIVCLSVGFSNCQMTFTVV